MSLDYLTLRVTRVIEETADSRSLEFELPEAQIAHFRYRPGQFLTLRVPCGDGWLPRCYSLSSTPLLDEPLRVTIKRVRDGRASNWLCDAVQAGDSLQVLAPAGVFVPPQLDTDLLLFGAGSGVTPMLSILRSALLAGSGRILLVYANRDEASVIFREQLKLLASAHPQRLQVIHWLDSVQGIPSASQLWARAVHGCDGQRAAGPRHAGGQGACGAFCLVARRGGGCRACRRRHCAPHQPAFGTPGR